MVLLLIFLFTKVSAQEQTNSWNENSVSRDFFNKPAKLPWKNSLGDWRDANGMAQGSKAFSDIHVADTDTARIESLDITSMAKDWLSGRLPNNGILVRVTNGGTIKVHSREALDLSLRPRLTVEFGDGRTQTLLPTDDVGLDASTHKNLGKVPILTVGASLLKFDLKVLGDGTALSKALLQLHTTETQYGATTIGIFHPDPGLRERGGTARQDVRTGLAAKYPGDRGIENDPDVVMASGFESAGWSAKWSYIQPDQRTVESVESAPALSFKPLHGKALQVVIPQGQTLGMNMLYLFAREIGSEPEEIYFRYYLRLADDWNPTVQGGKLPGIAGTYDRAGWGGRRSTGANGWSMRGHFAKILDEENPMPGLTPIGYYAYFADMPDFYGSDWRWTEDNLGLLERNRWYCIEQYVKLNDPNMNNGVAQGWIDGKLAFENNRILFRTTEALKIDRIWMNVYHGGTIPAPVDYHLFIDNVVVAKSYIGPIAGRGTANQ
jgi:hypothetical protein